MLDRGARRRLHRAAAQRVEGWGVEPRHFAERHGLIVLIALGESLVALGVGRFPHAPDGLTIVATLLGLAVVAALWWAYFDVVALVAERKLTSLTGAERNRMARDSYSYLHFLLVAGIVLFALGLKVSLGDLLGARSSSPPSRCAAGPPCTSPATSCSACATSGRSTGSGSSRRLLAALLPLVRTASRALGRSSR